MPNVLKNPVKERMNAGEAALGMVIRLGRSADTVRIAHSSGHDFIFIDVQHAAFDLETISTLSQAALALGIAPLVRVRGVDDPDVPVILDTGALGIVFPDVNTAEEARRAVERCKFAPIGKRSAAGGYPHFSYRPMALADSLAELNAACLVVCMIETREGLANVDEIAAVKGVDVLHVGANDLLLDMGKPGKFNDPEIVDAVARVIAAAKRNGIFAGSGGNRSVENQAEAIRRGARFVTTQADTGFLAAAANAWTGGVRKAVGAAS